MSEAAGQAFYILTEDDGATPLEQNAGPKAREDVRRLCLNAGAAELVVHLDPQEQDGSLATKFARHVRSARAWGNALRGLPAGTYMLNYPILHGSFLDWTWIRRSCRQGRRVVFVLHDCNTLRQDKRSYGIVHQVRAWFEERASLRSAARVVAHNKRMRDALVQQIGVDEDRIVCLGIFDYLVSPGCGHARTRKGLPVVVAGNLSAHKAGYLAHLPRGVQWALYGDGAGPEVLEQDHVELRGSFDPDMLPRILEGSFGLVWDGPSAQTCAGTFGEYLRINNPHRVSLYLCAGLPVIVWDQAALAELVLEEGAGLAVSSLDEVPTAIAGLSDKEYAHMCAKARELGEGLRRGERLGRILAGL